MKYVEAAEFKARDEQGAEFILDGSHLLYVQVLEDGLLRLRLRKNGSQRIKPTWSICPGGEELPFEGRDRTSMAGFSMPGFTFDVIKSGWLLTTRKLWLLIDREPFNLHLLAPDGAELLEGTQSGPLALGRRDERIWNFWRLEEQDRFYGLGEKSGGLDHAGRRLEMRCLDAMGYDAERSDPLYKHYPFLILKRDRNAVGLFYDNFSPVVFDTGQEYDNYRGRFFSYRAPSGEFDLYLIHGPRIKDVTERFSWMTGRTYFGPRWSLGYSGSTMAYTEATEPGRAQTLLGEFADATHDHAFPCHSFQLSSGYTAIGPKRYVFTWNDERIPDPRAMTRAFHERGIKIAANIKPVLIEDHPAYSTARDAGLFVRDSDDPDRPEVSLFWDARASHLDFMKTETREWWIKNIHEQLFAYGIDAIWNDNNEYEIWDDLATCAHPDGPLPIRDLRPVQTLLMMQTSYEAHLRRFPERRAWAISRSGCPGMQRYVQTWSGDNQTSWHTLKHNIRMGLSLSLSGMYNIGHDVGGFAGPPPEPELFVRWVQNGIFHPRFTIHSWNEDGSVTEPWMYPDQPYVLEHLRAALELRLRLAPYLYQLLYRAHAHFEPVLRPTFYDHEHDTKTFEETDDFMLGPSLLVASVVEPGAEFREVYLPDCPGGWVDFSTGTHHAGGSTIEVPVNLASIPLFVKAGHMLPMTAPEHRAFTDGGSERTIMIYPGVNDTYVTAELYEDDGESLAYRSGRSLKFEFEIACSGEEVRIEIKHAGDYRPPYERLRFRVMGSGPRRILIDGDETSEWPLSME